MSPRLRCMSFSSATDVHVHRLTPSRLTPKTAVKAVTERLLFHAPPSQASFVFTLRRRTGLPFDVIANILQLSASRTFQNVLTLYSEPSIASLSLLSARVMDGLYLKCQKSSNGAPTRSKRICLCVNRSPFAQRMDSY